MTMQPFVKPVLLFVTTLCLVMATLADAWSCTGHMLIAEIARRHLTPANRIKTDAMSVAFGASGPFPWTPDFVHLACWPDDLKSWRQYAMGSWHFIDVPYNPDNIPLPPGAEGGGEGAMNVVTASRAMITALKHASSSKSPAYVQLFSLVNLVHFIGDVHQPLHAAALFSEKYPHGDRGGNAETVTARGKELKLHALWDQMCQPNPHRAHRPYSEREYKAHITDMADYLETNYVFPTSMRAVGNLQTMADESHAFAVNTTYVGVEDGATLTEEYLLSCKRAAESRVTLAGLRLASILNPLLSELEGWDEAPVNESAHQADEEYEEEVVMTFPSAPSPASSSFPVLGSVRWLAASALVLISFLLGVLSTRYAYRKYERHTHVKG